MDISSKLTNTPNRNVELNTGTPENLLVPQSRYPCHACSTPDRMVLNSLLTDLRGGRTVVFVYWICISCVHMMFCIKQCCNIVVVSLTFSLLLILQSYCENRTYVNNDILFEECFNLFIDLYLLKSNFN